MAVWQERKLQVAKEEQHLKQTMSQFKPKTSATSAKREEKVRTFSAVALFIFTL